MIYGRFGNPVTIRRMAKISDVQDLDQREPDRQDREAIKNHAYVVVSTGGGKLRLYHVAYLRADGDSIEIDAVINACLQSGGLAP